MYVNVIDIYKCVFIYIYIRYIPMNANEIYEHGLMAIPQYGKTSDTSYKYWKGPPNQRVALWPCDKSSSFSPRF
jgi:hypothetical protein